MFDFFRSTGLYGYPLLLLTLALGILVLRGTLRCRAGHPQASTGAHTVLFWGVIAAVLGFLGQYHGMYNGLSAIARASEISPSVVARGFAESFTTTLWGMTLLVFSALAWFGLRAGAARRDTER